jgi:hypothetical protein
LRPKIISALAIVRAGDRHGGGSDAQPPSKASIGMVIQCFKRRIRISIGLRNEIHANSLGFQQFGIVTA